MKEVLAIIRPKKVGETRDALDALGFPSMTALSVLGRGRQRGIASECSFPAGAALLARSRSGGGMKYVPKRMLTVVVKDSDVESVVQTIIKVNQTAQVGDGKIFVCPIEGALRVRTNEDGDAALS